MEIKDFIANTEMNTILMSIDNQRMMKDSLDTSYRSSKSYKKKIIDGEMSVSAKNR